MDCRLSIKKNINEQNQADIQCLNLFFYSFFFYFCFHDYFLSLNPFFKNLSFFNFYPAIFSSFCLSVFFFYSFYSFYSIFFSKKMCPIKFSFLFPTFFIFYKSTIKYQYKRYKKIKGNNETKKQKSKNKE